MRVLDLFSGTGSWSQAFLDHGHTVIRVDNDPQFQEVPMTLIDDILSPTLTVKLPFLTRTPPYDVILASPPCQAFSLASIRHHFLATATCRRCGALLERGPGEEWKHSFVIGEAIAQWNCAPPWKEAPGSLLLQPKSPLAIHSLALVRRMLELIEELSPTYCWIENPRGGLKHFLPDYLSKTTVWYCRYGDPAAKPTNLWGRWPSTWSPRPECHRGNPDHQAAPRGSKTGTQGKKDAVLRAMIPYELSEEVCNAVEAEQFLDSGTFV